MDNDTAATLPELTHTVRELLNTVDAMGRTFNEVLSAAAHLNAPPLQPAPLPVPPELLALFDKAIAAMTASKAHTRRRILTPPRNFRPFYHAPSSDEPLTSRVRSAWHHLTGNPTDENAHERQNLDHRILAELRGIRHALSEPSEPFED